MKPTRRRRFPRKLILPLVALGMMIAAMGYDASQRVPYRARGPVTVAR